MIKSTTCTLLADNLVCDGMQFPKWLMEKTGGPSVPICFSKSHSSEPPELPSRVVWLSKLSQKYTLDSTCCNSLAFDDLTCMYARMYTFAVLHRVDSLQDLFLGRDNMSWNLARVPVAALQISCARLMS